jgi:hypothetical protein
MRHSQRPKDYEELRDRIPFKFSYAEWQELIASGKFDFTPADLTAATLDPDGYLGRHHGYPCFIDVNQGLVGAKELKR